jgi:PAS domain S-box-containing protein
VIGRRRDETRSALRGTTHHGRGASGRREPGALRERELRFRAVVDSSPDAIVSADDRGTIVSWNPAACRMFGYAEDEALGRTVDLLMPERFRDHHLAGLERLRDSGEARVIGRTLELAGLRRDGHEFPLELSLASWRRAGSAYYTGILRDITDRKKAELERERLIAELQEALARVKQLSGLIPICANCKKVRDDQGFWTQVENYVRDRSEASFSHSICPDCRANLYPEPDRPAR